LPAHLHLILGGRKKQTKGYAKYDGNFRAQLSSKPDLLQEFQSATSNVAVLSRKLIIGRTRVPGTLVVLQKLLSGTNFECHAPHMIHQMGFLATVDQVGALPHLLSLPDCFTLKGGKTGSTYWVPCGLLAIAATAEMFDEDLTMFQRRPRTCHRNFERLRTLFQHVYCRKAVHLAPAVENNMALHGKELYSPLIMIGCEMLRQMAYDNPTTITDPVLGVPFARKAVPYYTTLAGTRITADHFHRASYDEVHQFGGPVIAQCGLSIESLHSTVDNLLAEFRSPTSLVAMLARKLNIGRTRPVAKDLKNDKDMA
jgi:hypothetical protein